MHRTYGYIRVSTREQNPERQFAAMREAGIDEAFILVDKASGKSFDRPQYQLLKQILRAGDALVITSIDRLGRNYRQIQEEWQWFCDNGIGVKVVEMPLLNTAGCDSDLTRKFIGDLVLQVLAFVAQQERDNIHERQKQGIAAAKAKGIPLGRKRVLPPQGFEVIVNQWRCGEIDFKTALIRSGLARTTFYKLAKNIQSAATF